MWCILPRQSLRHSQLGPSQAHTAFDSPTKWISEKSFHIHRASSRGNIRRRNLLPPKREHIYCHYIPTTRRHKLNEDQTPCSRTEIHSPARPAHLSYDSRLRQSHQVAFTSCELHNKASHGSHAVPVQLRMSNIRPGIPVAVSLFRGGRF